MGYTINSLSELLRNNTYPGRGIVIGTTPSGKYNAAVYFIMGRSVNSRNRIFTETEDGIKTEAFDISKLTDPSLIIYHPVRKYSDQLIVTNGDQTDTIVNGLKQNLSFFESLQKRTFEPDAPNFTPRISSIVEKDGSYQLSILKSIDADGSNAARQFFLYPAYSGLGHFIHTYNQDGNPIESFIGEPERVAIKEDMNEFAKEIWESLNSDNKVSLFVRYTDLQSGTFEQRIFNKNR